MCISVRRVEKLLSKYSLYKRLFKKMVHDSTVTWVILTMTQNMNGKSIEIIIKQILHWITRVVTSKCQIHTKSKISVTFKPNANSKKLYLLTSQNW